MSTNLLLIIWHVVWSQVTHIPASTRMGGVYNAESHLPTVYTLAKELSDGTCLLRWLFSRSSILDNPLKLDFLVL